MRKPDGLVVVPPGQEAAFLAPLPVRRLWGVGPKMEEELARLGVATIGDLAALPEAKLERRFGTHGQDLQKLARGEDERPVLASSPEAKSLGAEHTYDQDTADRDRLRATLRELADTVARRLRAHGLRGRTITLKYRDETFRTVTRAHTEPGPPMRATRSSRRPGASSRACTKAARSAWWGSTPRTSAKPTPSSTCSRRDRAEPALEGRHPARRAAAPLRAGGRDPGQPARAA